MKFAASISFLLLTFCGYTQEEKKFTLPESGVERKIIIENGNYYFTTIDDEFQIGTMHTGKLTEPLKEEKKLAMPSGRNYNDPIIPFAWDIYKNEVYAVNFLVHPQNDRMEALKRFSFNSLQEWEKSGSVLDMVMLSTDYTPFAKFEPYAALIKSFNILDRFYFDGVALNDSTYAMVASNKNELSYWIFNGRYWLQSTVWNITAMNYYSLFKWDDKIYMYAWDGTIYKLGLEKMTPVAIIADTPPLKDITLIINRDRNTIGYIKNGVLEGEKSMEEILEKNAVTVLFSSKKK